MAFETLLGLCKSRPNPTGLPNTAAPYRRFGGRHLVSDERSVVPLAGGPEPIA
jgi:hypothetical protein